MADVLGRLPQANDPRLLVGFSTSDDAGVFALPDGSALVQTLDFFPPIVDDPYDYGQIAAANALSDVYAMGGTPVTALNIACFDPSLAPPEVWAAVLQGMHDKTVEAGAVLVGGHTVDDREPKFGMSVTGIVNPGRTLQNDKAEPGDRLWLSKPVGTGIVATAAKNDGASEDELAAAVATMKQLNRKAAEAALAAGARCATDVTGFGLAGHLSHIAKASGVTIEVDAARLPVLPGIERLIAAGHSTGGARRNLSHWESALEFADTVPEWLREVVLDPQTSGGLAVACTGEVQGSVEIGRILPGGPLVRVV